MIYAQKCNAAGVVVCGKKGEARVCIGCAEGNKCEKVRGTDALTERKAFPLWIQELPGNGVCVVAEDHRRLKKGG